MKRPAIDQLVYEYMLPRPKASDPPNFSGLLTRFLVFEVRQEVHSFYGHLDTQEAKYPGLDYCHSVHRVRLSRWPWHRRLFRAFDALRLTPAEIAHLTKWEGTKWAKERYEKEQSISIQDTAAEGMPDYRLAGSRLPEQIYDIDNYAPLITGPHPATIYESREELDNCLVGPVSVPAHPQVASLRGRGSATGVDRDEAMNDVDGSNQEDSDDGVTQSIGLQLNEQLRERVAAHNAGDTSQPLDEDWEQWLKNAIETGNLNMVAQHINTTTDLPFVHSPYNLQVPTMTSGPNPRIPADTELSYSSIVPSSILHAARHGNWDEVPGFLHEVLRQTIEAEASQEAEVPAAAPTTSSSSPSADRSRHRHSRSSNWRRTFSDLRLPSQ